MAQSHTQSHKVCVPVCNGPEPKSFELWVAVDLPSLVILQLLHVAKCQGVSTNIEGHKSSQ